MPSSIILAAVSTVVGSILPAGLVGFVSQIAIGVIGSVLPCVGERKPRR